MKKTLLVCLLGLSACTASATTLVSPEGYDAATIGADSLKCRTYAAELVAARASVPSLGVTAAASNTDEASLYVNCMQQKGYRLQGADLPAGGLR